MTATATFSPSTPSRPLDAAPPRPLSPLGGAVEDGAAVTFLWAGVPGARRYHLEVGPDRQFVRGTTAFGAGDSTAFTLHDALPAADAPLFWRVRAELDGGTTRWSPYGRFHVGGDAAVDAFRARREAERAEARKARLRQEAEEAAARDRVPHWERGDTVPSDFEIASYGVLMLASFVVLCLILFAVYVVS